MGILICTTFSYFIVVVNLKFISLQKAADHRMQIQYSKTCHVILWFCNAQCISFISVLCTAAVPADAGHIAWPNDKRKVMQINGYFCFLHHTMYSFN